MLTLNYIDKYLLSKPGAYKDYKEEWGWDRYLVANKMFAAVCTPSANTYKAYGGRTLLTLKCDTAITNKLREEHEGVIAGFYMNKNNWNSIYMDSDIPDEVMRFMLDMSYSLVFKGLTKKLRAEIEGGAKQ